MGVGLHGNGASGVENEDFFHDVVKLSEIMLYYCNIGCGERGRNLAIKAVFFDIDGTLLTDGKRVQRSTEQAIRELKKDGILVGLATGRGPAFAAPFMENYGLDFAVTYNGQYVMTRDEVIYANPLPKTVLFALMQYAKSRRIDLSFGMASGLMGSGLIHMGTQTKAQILATLLPKSWSRTLERVFKHGVRTLKPQNYDKLKSLLTEPVYQVVMVVSREKGQALAESFANLTVTRSSAYSADVISKNQSKLRGICRLAEHFGFELEEVMAFGDSDNDREMLSNVGIGVAMGNASQDLAGLAKYQTTNNNRDGIAQALFHYGLIQLPNQETFVSDDDNFNKVKAFHQVMDQETREVPQAFDLSAASRRVGFQLEELVEFLYANTSTDPLAFDEAIQAAHLALDQAKAKVQQKPLAVSPLVGQVDALTDLLYFTYGSFVLMGADPKPFFDRVHQANMGKLWPDGRPRFDPETGKVLKPDDWEERFAPEKDIRQELDRQIRKALKKSHQERE